MRRNQPRTRRSRTQRQTPRQEAKVPFIAHVQELRKRLFIVALSVGAGAGLAYSIQDQLTKILLSPAGNQQFIYTTPGGGFDFQFKLCLYAGIAASIPVIVYQFFRYIHPLLGEGTRKSIRWTVFSSSVLALAGIMFGYFIGLPAAMHFLLQSLSSARIEALISIQSYMSFVMIYLLGAALLFQIPLILLLINRIKPLTPKKLLQQQRWPVLGAFILGAIISPTPDIQNQLMLSGPIILMYELSIGLIWLRNRKRRRPKKALELLRKDAEIQAQRLAQFEKLRAQQQAQQRLAGQTLSTVAASSSPVLAASAQPSRIRPRAYVQDFTRRSYHITRPGTEASRAA